MLKHGCVVLRKWGPKADELAQGPLFNTVIDLNFAGLPEEMTNNSTLILFVLPLLRPGWLLRFGQGGRFSNL